MNPQNLVNNVPKKADGKTGVSGFVAGVLVGILQILVIFFVEAYFFSNFRLPFYAIPLIVGIIEIVLLHKRIAMLVGIFIGMILLPLLAFGACIYMLRGV